MITLGPILGVEQDYRYTVILLLPNGVDTANGSQIELVVSARGITTRMPPKRMENTFQNTLFRFEFEVDPSAEAENGRTTHRSAKAAPS
jgi:hypothetical protein